MAMDSNHMHNVPVHSCLRMCRHKSPLFFIFLKNLFTDYKSSFPP